MGNNFGLTNDKNELEAAIKFREAAIKDDWQAESLYPNHEDISQSTKLTKDGWVIQILARTNKPDHKFKYQVEVTIWAPDKLQILVPKVYDWNIIQQGMRRCNLCHKENVDTFRYSFAGRCCKSCLPQAQQKHEFPGWTS